MRVRISAIAVLSALMFSGCSVPVSPLTETEISRAADLQRGAVSADQEPLTRPVSLYEAMARALKYNLDYQVEAVQTSLRTAELDLAHYNLLPNVAASAGYAARDKPSASSSFNLSSNTFNFDESTSQEKRIRSSDLNFSWNILDFGLSYIRARQSADKVMIGEELQRKVAHRILEDVRSAYWRTVSSERLIRKLRKLEDRAQTALTNARSVTSGRQVSLITSLTYERELVEIRRAVKELQRDLVVAKSQLAALMNATPGTKFTVAIPAHPPRSPRVKMPLQTLIDVALRQRSEVRENLYQQRINEHEAQAALLELLPGINLYAAPNYDSNAFLLHNHWVGWGAKASWNLLRAFQYPAKDNVLDTQDQLLKTRALAITMAIMTQVHVSRIRYQHLAGELRIADEYRTVQNRLVRQIRSEAEADRVSEQTLIREELNTLVAEAKYDIAFASLESAYANLFASIGSDVFPALDTKESGIAAIADALRKRWGDLGDGKFGDVTTASTTP
jgi:outer membrane protein TolC